MTNEELKKLEDITDKYLADAREYCDAIQVLATHLESNGETHSYFRGSGNFMARVGLCRFLLIQDRVMTEENAKKSLE